MDRQPEIIIALEELVREMTSKLINLRVEAGLALKAKDAEIEELKKKLANGDSGGLS